MPPVHFTPTAGPRGEPSAEAGRHGKGWSCPPATELMLWAKATYGAEGLTASSNHSLTPTDKKQSQAPQKAAACKGHRFTMSAFSTECIY